MDGVELWEDPLEIEEMFGDSWTDSGGSTPDVWTKESFVSWEGASVMGKQTSTNHRWISKYVDSPSSSDMSGVFGGSSFEETSSVGSQTGPKAFREQQGRSATLPLSLSSSQQRSHVAAPGDKYPKAHSGPCLLSAKTVDRKQYGDARLRAQRMSPLGPLGIPISSTQYPGTPYLVTPAGTPYGNSPTLGTPALSSPPGTAWHLPVKRHTADLPLSSEMLEAVESEVQQHPDSLKYTANDMLLAVIRARRGELELPTGAVSVLGSPASEDEWDMPPQEKIKPSRRSTEPRKALSRKPHELQSAACNPWKMTQAVISRNMARGQGLGCELGGAPPAWPLQGNLLRKHYLMQHAKAFKGHQSPISMHPSFKGNSPGGFNKGKPAVARKVGHQGTYTPGLVRPRTAGAYETSKSATPWCIQDEEQTANQRLPIADWELSSDSEQAASSWVTADFPYCSNEHSWPGSTWEEEGPGAEEDGKVWSSVCGMGQGQVESAEVSLDAPQELAVPCFKGSKVPSNPPPSPSSGGSSPKRQASRRRAHSSARELVKAGTLPNHARNRYIACASFVEWPTAQELIESCGAPVDAKGEGSKKQVFEGEWKGGAEECSSAEPRPGKWEIFVPVQDSEEEDDCPGANVRVGNKMPIRCFAPVFKQKVSKARRGSKMLVQY